jgi:hypothetical protein
VQRAGPRLRDLQRQPRAVHTHLVGGSFIDNESLELRSKHDFRLTFRVEVDAHTDARARFVDSTSVEC